MHYRHLKLLVYACVLLQQVCCGPTVIYKSTNIECITIPRFTVNDSCRIKAVSWDRAVAQMDVDIVVPLRNISVNVKVLKKDYSNRYQPFLVDITVNMCDIMSKRSFATYGIMFAKFLRSFTNVNHSCPLQGHAYARNAYLDENLVPDFPLGFYQIVFVVIENYKHKPSALTGTIKYYFQAMERLIKKRKPKKA